MERLECNGLYCNHQYDCSKFYVIIYNHPVEMKCAPGTRFSLNLGVCDHESNVDCINDVEIQPDGKDGRVPDYANQLGVTIAGNFKDLIENMCLPMLCSMNADLLVVMFSDIDCVFNAPSSVQK